MEYERKMALLWQFFTEKSKLKVMKFQQLSLLFGKWNIYFLT